MGKKERKLQSEQTPAWRAAMEKIGDGPLFRMLYHTRIYRSDRYPMAKADWAYVTNEGDIYLNPHRKASAVEWEYIISHCMLHLGFGHFQKDRMKDARWNTACNLVVAKFLKDSHIGTPPPEFQTEFPFAIKEEEQTFQLLQANPVPSGLFSTMTGGRPDLVWTRDGITTDYPERFAESLQASLQNALMESRGLSTGYRSYWMQPLYLQARDWFLSSFPLLGAVASAFRIIDDTAVVSQMNLPVAAVSPQLGELYINSRCRLNPEEWKFVLAHEFLHAALRHDLRCEDRLPELWNVACDYVVNSWLCEMKVGSMPDSALFDNQFQGMSAEAVYDQIYENLRQYLRENPGDLLYGNGTDAADPNGNKLDAVYRSALQQGLIYHTQQNRGYLPAGLVEEIHALSRPSISWDVELGKWFDENFTFVDKHRSYARLSRRQSSTPDIPRPAWRLEEYPKQQRTFAVLLDTSGSMSRSLLAAALGSIASYSEARDVPLIRVIFCDAAVYDQGMMTPEEIAGAVQIKGRGSTKLQAGIDLLESDLHFPKDTPLLIITDGACDRLNLRGRKHAYLIPWGNRLSFPPKGPVFRLK